MESMPSGRRAKIKVGKQTSASHANGPAVTMTIITLGSKKSPQRETPQPRRYSWNPDVVLIISALSVHTKSSDALPRIFPGCIWALALRSHHATPPGTLEEGRRDRVEFRSSQPRNGGKVLLGIEHVVEKI